jgi:peptidoglycan/LPS O-acetylase OafA/YrhL
MTSIPRMSLAGESNDTSAILDLTRWTAAQAVCVGHSLSFFGIVDALRPPNSPSMQSLAVIVFFVLSGFLIAHALQRRPRQIGHGFGEYMIDRTARIYIAFVPCLLIIALIDLCLIGAGLHPNAAYVTPQAFLGSLLMMQNYPGAFGASLEIPSFGSAGQLWSLAVEFHIYVFAGACFFALRPTKWWAACVAVAIVSSVVPLNYLNPAVIGTPGASLSWLWILGFAIYYIARGTQLHTAVGIGAAYAGAIALVVAWYRSSPPGAEYEPRAYFILAVAFLLLILASQRTTLLARSSRLTRCLRVLADYSFSLYLLHYTILFAIHAIWDGGGVLAALIGIAISNIFAFVVAQFTECRHKEVAGWIKQKLYPIPVTNSPLS